MSHKNDQEAMEQYLAGEPERLQFYERLTAFAKTMRLALASVSFHEKTASDLIARYRRDLKYFMQRVRRAIHEHVDEDPVFYRRLSELIDKTLADAKAERISQLELLVEMEDIRDRVRDRRAYEDVPEVLTNRDVAKSYYDVLRDEATAAGLPVPDGATAALAARVDDIIRAKRKVDWADDVDVQNQMKIAIEDELFAFNKDHGIQMAFDTIDRVLDRVVDVARRRVP